MKITLKDGVFVAKDEDGEVWWYSKLPIKRFDNYVSREGDYASSEIPAEFINLPDLGPWEDSLHIVKNGELVKYVERPEIAVDTPVWVRDYEDERWTRRYFLRFSDNGMAVCWAGGRTSFSACGENDTVSWRIYSLTDPTKKEEK